jgi:6-hydroxynicotinate 3-monooxygenase
MATPRGRHLLHDLQEVNMSVSLKVAVIGAGIGGLAAARTLRDIGCDVQVYEQAKAFGRVGAGIQMSANAMRVLRGLSLEEHVRSIAFQPPYWRNRDWDTGNLRFELELGAAAEGRYGAPYLLMHRADLHEALASRVPADTVHLDHKLVELEQPASGGVVLKFANGEEAHADVVIGADGVHSRVRQIALGNQPPDFSGRVAYRATFDASLLNGLQIDDCTKWWGPDRHIVIYFTKADRSELYFVTSVPESDWKTESWSATGDLDELRAAFAGFHPHVRAVLDACPQAHKWALLERAPLPSWVNGTVALLGDACHPMTPYMAQGAAMAMEDGVVLARCLDGVAATPAALHDALRRFENLRKERTSSVQHNSHLNQWMKDKTNPDWVYGYDAWSATQAAAA